MTLRTVLLRVALTTLSLAAILVATNLTHTRVHAADPHPSSAPPPVTWSHDIAPLAYKNCSTCHHTGGAGPFSLLTYEDARRWGAQMQDVTQSRYMPPWLPEHRRATASYIAFQDERILTDAEINLIAAWVKSGMPEGNPADAPPVPHYSETWQYGKPDLILKVQRPYMLEASGSDVFRNFVLPYPLGQTHYIRAMEIRPGAPQIVHHANVLIDRTGSYRREHPDAWQDGIPGMELAVDAGNEFDPDSHFLFWKPDTPYLIEPATMPWHLDPGNDLILNMHLKPSGKAELVTAEVGLYFTDTPPTEQPMLLQLEHDSALDIPANAANFIIDDSLKLPIDVDVLGIYPHTHYLGRHLEAWATLPNQQKKWLIDIPSWDIDRQSVYRYLKPVRLPKGTVVHMHYIFDNSTANPHNPHSPPIRVRAGNRSEDEMAHLWLQVLPVNTPASSPDPRLLLEEAWMRERLSKEPTDTLALYNLASTESSLGHSKEAIAAYQQALVLHPGDERTLTGLGAAFEASGDWQAAAKVYEQAIGTHPETCDARFNLAELELKHDQPAAAEQHLRNLLTHCPPDAAAHSALGAALLAQDQTNAATTEFQTALQINSSDFTALLNLGGLALQAGASQQALDYLAAAARQRPADIDTLEQLAGAYVQSGLYDNAVEQLNVAIKLAPQNPTLHALLSQVLSTNDHLAMAIEEQKKALQLDADDPDGWNNLGVMQARNGNTTEARLDFLRALQLNPSHSQARSNLHHLPPQ
jgi:Flp pilus assembly protein TadD/mono/diheme cytochrome c family protein